MRKRTWLTRQAADTSRVGSSARAVSTSVDMNTNRASLSGFSFPTDQMMTEARLRSRRISSVSWFFASASVAGLSKAMDQ